MAAELGDATLELNTDATKYEKGLSDAESRAKRFGETASDNAGKAQDGMDNAGKSAGGLGVKLGDVAKIGAGFALGAGITAAPGYLMDAARAAAEDEQASARLAQTIRNLGGDFDAQMKAVEGAISSGEQLAFTDDEVRDSFNTLAAATGSSEEALARQKVAMDLARGANIPLAQATKYVSKVNEESVDAFTRLGIVIKDGSTEAEALAQVQAKFAGQSEVYASSTAGQFEVAQIRMAEAQETIGMALLPVMTSLATIASVVLPVAFTALGTAIQGLGTAIGFITEHWVLFLPVGTAIAALLGVALVAALGVVIPLIWAKAAAWTAAAIAMLLANAPLLLLAIAIGAIIAVAILLIQNWDTLVEKFPILGVIAEQVKAVLQGFVGFITGTFVPGVTGGFQAIISFVSSTWPTLEPLIMGVFTAILSATVGWFGGLAQAFQGGIDVVMGIIDVFVGLFTGDWERMWSGIQRIAEGAFGIISGIFRMQLAILTGAWEVAFAFLNTITGGKFGEITSTITSSIGTIASTIGGFVANMWSWASQIGEAVINAAQPFWTFRDWVVGALGEVFGWIDSLIGKINSIPNPMDKLGDLAGGLNPFATGVRNAPRGMALVGEQGPELVRLRGGEDIFNARETVGMLRRGLNFRNDPLSGGTGSGVNVNFNGPTEILARDRRDAERGAGNVGWATMTALKTRGVRV